MEARLTKLNNLVLENAKMESVDDNQDLHALEDELKVRKDELKVRKDELLAAEKSIARLTNEKLILARKLSELKKRNADEINLLERRFELECKDLKSQVNDLEEKLEGFRQELAAAESTLLAKDAELVALHNNLWELENLRDMTEDDTHEKEAKLRESEGSVEQPASLRAAPDQPESHGQVYGSSSHQGLVEASFSQTALAPQAGTTGRKRPREGDLQQRKAELQAAISPDFLRYRDEFHAHQVHVWNTFTQAYQEVFARLNPGKPIPQLNIPPPSPPPLEIIFPPREPLLFSMDQATDSVQQQQDHKNQPDV